MWREGLRPKEVSAATQWWGPNCCKKGRLSIIDHPARTNTAPTGALMQIDRVEPQQIGIEANLSAGIGHCFVLAQSETPRHLAATRCGANRSGAALSDATER